MKEARSGNRGIGNLAALLPWVRRHWAALAVGFAFMLVQNYGAVRVPAYFQKILDELTGANRAGVIMNLVAMAGLYAAVTVVAMYIMRRLIIGASRQIEYSLRERIYERLLELDYSFFQAHETGDLVSRTTNDLDHVRTLLGPGIMYIPNSLSMFALFFPVLFRLNGPLMLLVSGVLVALIAIVFIVLPRLEPFFRRIQESTGKINSSVWQVVSGITTVKLHTMEAGEEKRFTEHNREFLRRNMATVKIQEFLWPTFIFVFSITQLVVIFAGGRQVIAGAMSLGQLLQFNVMITALTFPVLSLGWIMSLIQQGISAMGRINTILEGPVERRSDWSRLEGPTVSFEARDLHFSYPGHEKPCLDGVTLSIGAGEFIGITGTIGSGKSTLVNVLTGLLKPERGAVFANGIDVRDIEPSALFRKIGIVSQSPFLFSRTLAENISMGTNGAPDDVRVKEAARLAGLELDVAAFPEGYGQMIGERGITLSGGQKQRAAIARALMKDSPVVILDDALSSVDARTESTIIDNLRSLRGSKTLIVVSHRISPLKGADRIYVMDEGKVVEQGSHEELASQGGLYERLVRYQQMEKSLAPPPAPQERTGMETEKKPKAAGVLKRIVPYVGRHAWLGIGSLACIVIVNAAGVLQPYLVKHAIDANIVQNDIPGLMRTGLLLALVMLAGYGFQVLSGYGIQFLGQKFLFDLRMDLFRKVLGLSNDYFDRTPVGTTLTNLSNDVEALREFIAEGIVSVAGDMLKICFILAAMLLINFTLALVAFITIPLFIAATLLFRSTIRGGYRQIRKSNGEINVSLSETISGIREIHQFGSESESRESFARTNTRYLTAYLKVVNAYALFFPAIEIVANASMILTLAFAHFWVGTTLQVGEIFAFFSYINMLFWPLRELAEKFNLLQSARAATERIFALMDEKVSISSPGGTADRPIASPAELVFDNVQFHYAPDAPVLRGISFRVSPGEKVAIVGPTGSGKTTLISLVTRLYDVREGRILLDGMDIRGIPLETLRRAVATVPQDVFLFTGTVAENISLYEPTVDARTVEHAGREVRADRFVAQLPKGYAEAVGEEGKRLSEGQRQLLGLSRAFARNPSLVILDEATSNIDSETEHLIGEGIARLLKDRTALIIAHRLSTIRSVDRILVMLGGEIVQEGSHDELIGRDGLYRQLYEMQSLLLAK